MRREEQAEEPLPVTLERGALGVSQPQTGTGLGLTISRDFQLLADTVIE